MNPLLYYASIRRKVQTKKFLKILLYFFLGAWTLFFVIGITGNYKHYDAAEWVIILLLVFCPFLIIAGIKIGKKKDRDRKQRETFTQTYTQTPPAPLSDSEHTIVQKTEAPEPAVAYIETDGVIMRTDGKEIEDSEIPHLIKMGYESAKKNYAESPNPKFHRTQKEDNLSFNFITKYLPQVKELEAAFKDSYRKAAEAEDYDQKIALLQETIRLYEKAKHFCYSKGKGGTIYFDDMWEHLHNSVNPDFSYIANVYDEIEHLQELHNEVIPQIKISIH